MVTIPPHAPLPLENAVDRARHANRNAARSVRKRASVVGFDQEVKVVGLHREMDQSKRLARCLRQRISHGRKHAVAPQARQAPQGAQRHVHGVTALVHGPRDVRHSRPLARRLPPRAVTAAAPSSNGKLLLPRWRRASAGWPARTSSARRAARAEGDIRYPSGLRAATTIHLDSAIILERGGTIKGLSP
jgi:hypothetical protein